MRFYKNIRNNTYCLESKGILYQYKVSIKKGDLVLRPHKITNRYNLFYKFIKQDFVKDVFREITLNQIKKETNVEVEVR